MLVVGFDTATPAVSVALHDGERVVAEASAADGRRHGELLAPMIAKVLADAGASRADLTAVAVGVGPGPYTGLRVGVVTARVLGAVLGIPVHGVCSLDVIAAAVTRPPGGSSWWRPTRAARRSTGPGTTRPARAWRVPRSAPPAVHPRRRRSSPWPAAGGSSTRRRSARSSAPPTRTPGTLCALVAGSRDGQAAVPLLAAEPLYLRRPDAREPGPPKRVTPS